MVLGRVENLSFVLSVHEERICCQRTVLAPIMADHETAGRTCACPRELTGRGRLLLTVVMICLALVAYVSRRGPSIQRSALPAPTDAPRLHPPLTAMEEKANILNQLGPALTGSGNEKLVSLAAKLSAVAPAGVVASYDVAVLQDSTSARTFAFEDGTIWFTRGLLERLETEGEVAALLCQEMERIEFALGTLDDIPITGSLSVQMLTGAGYDPRSIVSVQRKQYPVTGQTTGSSPNEALDSRVAYWQNAIREQYPGGVPGNLKP